MTDPQVAVFMLGMFIVLIMLGFPIAFTLMGMGIGFGYYAYFESARLERMVTSLAGEDPGTFDTIRAWAEALASNRIFDLLVNQTYSVMSNDALTAVPLFLFMGYIVERSEIIGRLFATLNVATRHIPGSMAVAALVTCALFATATGIVGAVVTLMGLLAFPSMLKARYDISLASGVICAGGCLGILIPPSVMLIVYGATSGVSVVRLYAAAFLPGFLLAGLYIVYVITRASINPSLAPKPRTEDLGDTSIGFVLWSLLTSFLPLAVLILAVLGAIVFGLATPSEAAAIGALGGLAARRRLPRADLGAAAGVGLSHHAHLGDGLLALRRLVHLRLGLRLPRRAGGDRRLHGRPRAHAAAVPDPRPGRSSSCSAGRSSGPRSSSSSSRSSCRCSRSTTSTRCSSAS